MISFTELKKTEHIILAENPRSHFGHLNSEMSVRHLR